VLGVARVLVVGEEEGNDVGGNCHYMTEEQESADDAGSRVPRVVINYMTLCGSRSTHSVVMFYVLLIYHCCLLTSSIFPIKHMLEMCLVSAKCTNIANPWPTLNNSPADSSSPSCLSSPLGSNVPLMSFKVFPHKEAVKHTSIFSVPSSISRRGEMLHENSCESWSPSVSRSGCSTPAISQAYFTSKVASSMHHLSRVSSLSSDV
jgi:hypothetical protein